MVAIAKRGDGRGLARGSIAAHGDVPSRDDAAIQIRDGNAHWRGRGTPERPRSHCHSTTRRCIRLRKRLDGRNGRRYIRADLTGSGPAQNAWNRLTDGQPPQTYP